MKRFAEAQSGILGVPVVVQPVPVHHDLVAVLVEIRDIEVAVAVLNVMYSVPSVPPPLE